MSAPLALVSKLWNYCNILRDDGLPYGDYVEQLTFLLFLKMADDQAKPSRAPPPSSLRPSPARLRQFGLQKAFAAGLCEQSQSRHHLERRHAR
jgi:hypothetical protein